MSASNKLDGTAAAGSAKPGLPDSRGSILALVVVFMMVFSIIGIATIGSTCYQEIQANAEVNVYRANLLADAGLEWGKLWISSSCVIQNVFPENISRNSDIIIVASNQTVGPSPRGYYTTGIYPLPGNNVNPMSAAQSSTGTYVITTTATITLGAGTMDTVVCKTIEVYLQNTSSSALAGPMQTARCFHTATLLQNGKVLIAGGANGVLDQGFALSSAELYDPDTNTFTPAGSMNVARLGHTATLLTNGQVLITGGAKGIEYLYGSKYYNLYGNEGVLNTAELYNPASNSFTLLTSTYLPVKLSVPRVFHTATLVVSTSAPQGDVIIVGGCTGFSGGYQTYDNSVDLYVSSASVFQPINSYQYYPWSNSPVNGCNLFTAVPLNNGSVLYCGGETNMDGDYVTTNLAQTCDYNGTFVNGLYIYMTSVRAQHTATLLTNGQALITGGVSANFISGAALSSAELYDPVAKAFTATGSMSVARYGHTATLLTGCANAGKVLVAGGNENGSTPELALVSALLELYDPASGQFSKSGSMSTPRSNFTATMLNNGLVLFAGGLGEYNPGLIGGNANVLSSAELYGGLMDGKYVANTYTEYPTVRQPH